MAENPAKHFRLDHIKGALTPGKDADIVVLEPRDSVYDASASGNNVVGWSPYNDIRLPLDRLGHLSARRKDCRGREGAG